VKRTAGWWGSPLVVTVQTIISGSTADQSWTYFIRGIESYPDGSRPYNESIETGITVTEDDIVVGTDVNQFDFDDATFTVTNPVPGTARIEGLPTEDIEGVDILSTGEGGGQVLVTDGANGASWSSVAGTGDVVSSESTGTVVDEELVVFDGTTGKLIKGLDTTLIPTTLDDVINAASPDNDVNVPQTDPVILRDGDENITPLSVVKLDASLTPAIIAEVPGTSNPGLRVQSTGSPLVHASLSPSGLSFAPVTGEDANIFGPSVHVVANEDLALYANGVGGGGSITIGVGGMDTPDEIEFVQGITVGETAGHPVTPVDDKGQFWVNNDGEPIFTSASNAAVNPGTDYDLTAGFPHTLDEVIASAPIDNALTVPSGNPLIFTDGAVAGLSPLTVSKSGTSTFTPALAVEHVNTGVGIFVENTTTGSTLAISSLGATPADDESTTITFGGGLVATVAAGSTFFAGRDTAETSADGGDVYLHAGESLDGTPGGGGDALIDPGDGDPIGDIKFGTINAPNEILFAQGITIMEASSQPLAGAQAGKGQFWVNDATSPNKPYYTDEDGASFDLTTGSGVGDVTATAALPDNALVRGDGGVKGVQADAASTLSDAGDLLIENDITAGNDVIATNDVTSTVDVNVGADLNVPSGDIVIGVGQTVDGRDVSVDGGVLDGHVAATSGNPHDVEGTEVLSTTEADGLVLTSDGADGSSWESVGTGDVTSSTTITDHTIVRGDGGTKGVQESGIAISDTDDITGVVDLTLSGDITSTGAVLITATDAGTTAVQIDNGTSAYTTILRPDGLIFTEGGAEELQYSIVVGPKNDAAKADDITIEAGTNAGAGDGGDVLIDSGAGAGAGADGQILLGSLLNTSAIGLATTGITTTAVGPLAALEGLAVTGDITVTGDVDGIDVGVDVAANTTHRGLTDGNPHAVNLETLGAGTHAQLEIAAANSGKIIASAQSSQISSLDLVTVASGDHILVEDASDANNKKRIAASDFLVGSGNVSNTGTPLDDQYARWTDATTIEGRTLGETQADLSVVIGTDVQAWDTVLDSTTASFLTAQETKINHISVTQAVDLDTIESDTATNTSAISGLGTASVEDVGTGIDNVVQMIDSGGAKLPAVDGSLLTNLPGGGGVDTFVEVITTATTDNDVTVPNADPIILRDSGTAAPLSIITTDTASTPWKITTGHSSKLLSVLDDGAGKQMELYVHGILMAEGADHPNLPDATEGCLWVKNTNPTTLVFTNGAGSDTELGAGGGSGDVSATGTPVDNDWARFTDATTIEGRSDAEIIGDLSLEIGVDVQAYAADLDNVSGSNSGDQTITLEGNVTGTGTGTFTATIADNAVGLDEMAGGTDGNLITYDASGDPAYVATGTSTQVLTSNGAGAAPTFEDSAVGGDVSATGTPLITEYARWTDATTVEGRTKAETQADLDVETGVDFDPVGTDNSTDVTLANSPSYLSLSGQVLTHTTVDLASEVEGELPIADIAGTPTGTGDLVLETSPTIVTPTIASFANSAHDHSDAAGGGQIDTAGLADNAVTNTKIEDKAVGVVNMLDRAANQGELLTWAASGGVATTVAAGADGHVLTSKGTGEVPVFEAAAGAPSLTKSITIEDPAADENVSMFFTTVAITVTQITAVIQGSTSVDFNIEHGASRASGTDVMTADDTADSTTTGNITTSGGFTDATIPADSFVWLTTSALSGTPTELNVTIEYTED
jgi:hypothetical protein